jgi:hypothetical protein
MMTTDPMEDFHLTDDPTHTLSWRARVWRWFLTIAGIGLAIFIYLWFFVPPKVPTAPIHLIRSSDGDLRPAMLEKESNGVAFEAQMGKLQSSCSFTSASVGSESSPARFACSRIGVFNRSPHLLMARIGSRLLDHLKPVKYLQQVDYYPTGFHAEDGERAPDLAIVLDLEKLTENPGLLSSSLEANISVRAGNQAPDCHNSYVDSMTSPLVQFDWFGRLEYRSTRSGAASSAAKYQQVAEDLAKQIAQALTKELDSRRTKYGPMPELPGDFYPAYRTSATLPFDGLGNVEPVWSWHGLLNHNETLWRIRADRRPAELVGELKKRLKESGWEGPQMSGDPASPYVRVHRQSAVVQVYPSSAHFQPNDGAAQNLVYVHYLDRMTQSEMTAAIDGAINSGVSDDVLLLFERQWSEAQQQKVLKRLQALPPRHPETSMTLARLYHRLHQDAEAKRELLLAQILLRTVQNAGDLEGRFRALAKELGDEKLAERPVDIKGLVDLGFKKLTPGTPVAPTTVGFDEPVCFFLEPSTPSDRLRTIALRAIKPESTGSSTIGLAHVDVSQNQRSWGTGGPEFFCGLAGGKQIRFKVEKSDSAEKCRITGEWIKFGG